MVVVIFSNDDSAGPPALLKTESPEILVGQVDKFEKNCFKETCERLLLLKQKVSILRACYKICSPKH